MAFDEQLGQRIANLLERRGAAFVEKRMFGGLGFMIDGKMSIGVVKDEIMLRVLDKRFANIMSMKHVREMDFAGRPMKGFVYVERPGFATDELIEDWIDLAIEFGKLGVVKNKKKK